MMFPDFLELLRAFEKYKVRYVIIGGYAVGIHAEPRYTKDLDILVEPSPSNAKKLLRALGDFGAPIDNLTIDEVATPGLLYVFGIPPLRVDILNRIRGIDVAAVIKRGKKLQLDDTRFRIVSLEDLVVLKLIAGRPQDKADLAKLRELYPQFKKKSPSASKQRPKRSTVRKPQ